MIFGISLSELEIVEMTFEQAFQD